jgi:hypothetical protein
MRLIFPNDWTALESHPKTFCCSPITMLDCLTATVTRAKASSYVFQNLPQSATSVERLGPLFFIAQGGLEPQRTYNDSPLAKSRLISYLRDKIR